MAWRILPSRSATNTGSGAFLMRLSAYARALSSSRMSRRMPIAPMTLPSGSRNAEALRVVGITSPLALRGLRTALRVTPRSTTSRSAAVNSRFSSGLMKRESDCSRSSSGRNPSSSETASLAWRILPSRSETNTGSGAFAMMMSASSEACGSGVPPLLSSTFAGGWRVSVISFLLRGVGSSNRLEGQSLRTYSTSNRDRRRQGDQRSTALSEAERGSRALQQGARRPDGSAGEGSARQPSTRGHSRREDSWMRGPVPRASATGLIRAVA